MEGQESEKKGLTEGNRIVLLLVMLVLLGIGLIVTPMLLYPNNIQYDDSVDATNDFTTRGTVTLEPGTYEVWTTTSWFGWFDLDTPLVYVNETGGSAVSIDYQSNGDHRDIEGEECQHFATFEVTTKREYNLTIIASPLSMDFAGRTEVYVLEERPAAYGAMQWSGIILMVVGIMAVLGILFIRWSKKADARAAERKAQMAQAGYPPHAYPPPGYQQYPPPGYYQQPPPGYQQAPYGQYPPPPQPPPGGQPPPPPPPVVHPPEGARKDPPDSQ